MIITEFLENAGHDVGMQKHANGSLKSTIWWSIFFFSV